MNVKLLKVNDTIKDKHLGVGVIIAVNTQYDEMEEMESEDEGI